MTTKGVETDQYLGPLTSFSSLKYLSVDQNHLSSEAVLPDCLEKLDLNLRDPLRIDLIRHLARVSHTLLSLQSIQLRIDDYNDDIDDDDDDYRSILCSCDDIDFKIFEFHERVVVEFLHVATITSAIYFTWNVLAHGAESTNLLQHYSTKKKKKKKRKKKKKKKKKQRLGIIHEAALLN
ncbi:hypothetical protein N7530_008731 [Penicillium desertorum]|uniref:Uncharacterized protein n=1 Tax=Penicillium desertorum TaxID=1303715 RepID=A0A9W9WPU7_9EURO|nr:hypothetical protein N7530_008731 [Penicillium desertorum]